MVRTLRDNFGAVSAHSTTAIATGTPATANPLKRSFLQPGNTTGSQTSTLRLPSTLSTQGNAYYL